MQRTTLDPPTEPTPAVTADTMKAIVQDRYGSGEVLELREIDKPAIGDRDALPNMRQRPKLSYRRSQPTSRSKRQRPFPWRAPSPSRRFVITAMSRPD